MPCHRGGARPVVAMILQPAVSCSQARRDFPSDHQFKEAQPPPRGSIIQNGNHILDHSSTPASGMDHQDRFEGRLPSRLGPSQHQEILLVHDIGKNIQSASVKMTALIKSNYINKENTHVIIKINT